MKALTLTIILSTFISSPVFAGACEENFSRTGNPISGTEYKTSISLADVSTLDALGQVRGIATRANMSIILDESAAGSLLVEEPATFSNKAIPIVFTASLDGNVSRVGMSVKVNRGAFSRAEDMKKYMCDLLVQVKGGREGQRLAMSGRVAVSSVAPVRKDAYIFGQELAHEAKDSASAIPLRYRGRRFTISGRVKYVIRDGDLYRVNYDFPETNDPRFRLSNAPLTNIGISCLMAPGQNARAISLRAGDRIELTGTFHNFDEFRHHFWLNNCSFAI